MKLSIAVALMCLLGLAHAQQFNEKDEKIKQLITELEARVQVVFNKAEGAIGEFDQKLEEQKQKAQEAVRAAQDLFSTGSAYLFGSQHSSSNNQRYKRDTVENIQGGVDRLSLHFKNDVSIIVRFFWTLLENTEDIIKRVTTEVFKFLSALPFFGLFLGGPGGLATRAAGGVAAGIGSGISAATGLANGLTGGLAGELVSPGGLGAGMASSLASGMASNVRNGVHRAASAFNPFSSGFAFGK